MDPASSSATAIVPVVTSAELAVVRELFLAGARTAAALGQAPARLAAEVEPGVTLADELHCVAVHNAYHFGRIVALRQRIGAWPATAAAEHA